MLSVSTLRSSSSSWAEDRRLGNMPEASLTTAWLASLCGVSDQADKITAHRPHQT